MTSFRSLACAALLAFTALNLTPTLASAQEPVHGKFTLTHDVLWQNAKIPAGDYQFSFAPDTPSRMLRLSKINGNRAAYWLMVPAADEAKGSGSNRLTLETTPGGSYVSAMHLPEFSMTLYFSVPSHPTERQIAKAETTAAAAQ